MLAQKPQFTNAKLDAATVYFNAAELTHSLSANLSKGTNEIVVKNVANKKYTSYFSSKECNSTFSSVYY